MSRASTRDASRGRRKRAKVEREPADIAAMLERMIRAYGRRVAAADPEDLARMMLVQQVMNQVVNETGRAQLEVFSTAQLGLALGRSKQSVHQRFSA